MTYAQPAAWSPAQRLTDWLLPRVLELTYTAWDLQPFAKDCGYHGPPFRWNDARRFMLRCELEAAYFHLYGIARDDVDYIMETFPIVKRKDEAAHGEYRTKRVILEDYDVMQHEIDTRQPYQTSLDPPPADPRVAHPPRAGLRRWEPTPQPARNKHPAPAQKPMPRPPVPQPPARAVVREEPQPYKSEPTSRSSAPRSQPASRSALPLKPKSEGNGSPQRPLFDGGEGAATPTGNTFRVGQNVWHRQFGAGQVIAVQGSGSEQLLTVRFKSAGTKKLMASMANLEPV